MKIRIHTAIISITLLVTTILTFFLTYYLVGVERKHALEELQSTISRNNELLQLVNFSPLYNLDKKNLEINLRSFYQDKNMIEISLDEFEGDIHISLSRPPLSPKDFLIESTVVIGDKDLSLGTVKTVYSTSHIEKKLVTSRNKHLVFSLVLLFSFSLIIFFLVKYFTAPIERLTEAAKKIADGNLDVEVETKGAYELATLGTSFNFMRNAVKEKISDLAKQNQALEHEVAIRKETEKALKRSETKFTSLFMATPVMTTLTTLNGDVFIDVNEAFIKTSGYTKSSVLGKTSIDLALIPDQKCYVKIIQNCLETGVIFNEKMQLQTKDGDIKELLWFAEKLHLDGEDLLLNVFLDVTKRNIAENENRYLRNLLKNTFDSMPSILVGVDYKGLITQWNQHAVDITGKSLDMAINQRFNDVLPYPVELQKIQDAISSKIPVKISKLELNDEQGVVDITIYPLIEGNVKEAVIRVDDISERVKMDEMIVQSEKMLSVGGLAAGMAHEINNPLAGVMQNIQVIVNRTKPEQPKNRALAEQIGVEMEQISEYLDKRGILSMTKSIMESSMRAAKIVENMLNFSRKGSHIRERVDFASLLDQTIELAGSDYDLKKNFDFKHIRIIREYQGNLPLVLCDKSKIQQVLLNLLQNGAHAMEAFTIENQRPCFTLRLTMDGSKVTVQVEDNGSGMDAATTKRVFEPFFTTKSVGQGTGLGLSVSYFIITEDHDGTMMVNSSPGQGTKFSFTLPATPAEKEETT